MELKRIRKLLSIIGFTPQEGAKGIFQKKYSLCGDYLIVVDCDDQSIDYGSKIKCGSKRTQNFSQDENFVVLECVDRLLMKGYKPENIFLEKGYPAGRGVTKYLDILVSFDEKPYLMIECKTYGEEYGKELKKIQKDGGQIFTYFQQDTKVELLMLYTSKLGNDGVIFDSSTIEIEEEFRNAGSVKQAHNLWNGAFYATGFWENPPYNFETGKFTKNNLRELNETEGQSLFNKFATILRKHSVSDKPNAFNKIFNLFLAKLFDEQKKQNDELEFHWRDDDNPVDFQVRLFNLHKEGLWAFLKKELAGIRNEDFEGTKSAEELLQKKKNVLKINKIYDIKEVFDDDTFEQNHRVLREVVELLQQYQIRYPRKQRHLSEFFEQLLTTGLKQEAGQYFTPPTITKFIVRSLPLPKLLEEAINQPTPTLPAAIDYAAGSGHFITEILEEYQDIIEKLNKLLDTSDFFPNAKKVVRAWSADQYNWAATYVYGIEKDYRLVKVAKVGCYFYGDGLAQIILGDGLDSFEKSKSYIDLLKKNAKKPQFSILVSNPPYSVDGVKDDLEYIGAQDEFTLFKNLTDKSSEIEALFVERADQLLKENGVAGIVLPSSILSNGGIYAKTREIILQNFDVVAITQLGGNTFLATNTNTIVLFLRKRNLAEVKRIKEAAYRVAENYPKTHDDFTINGIETPVKKYLDYTGETEVNPEKFYYFVLNYHQKTVIVKTGEKEDEKRFLGYKIVGRRGHEGYHAIQGGKTIDDCTKLYSDTEYEDETKASTYIYKAFNGEFPEIHETLRNNVFCVDFIDMLAFDREKFEKNISLTVKKKVKIKYHHSQVGKISDLCEVSTEKVTPQDHPDTEYAYLGLEHIESNTGIVTPNVMLGSQIMSQKNKFTSGDVLYGKLRPYLNKVATPDFEGICSTDILVLKTECPVFLKQLLLSPLVVDRATKLMKGTNLPRIGVSDFLNIKVPVPPSDVQAKIVEEIEALEKKENEVKKKIEKGKEQIESICLRIHSAHAKKKLRQIVAEINPSKAEIANLNADTMISFVDMPSVSNNGYIERNIARPFSEIKKGSYTYFREGDIIIAKITPCMENGKCALATNLTNGVALGSSEFHVFRADVEKIDKKFLFTLLNRKSVRIEAEKNMTGASGHRRVPVSFYENLEIPLPTLSEQQKIVAKIEKLESEIAELQKELESLSEQKNAVLKKWL